MRRGSGHWGHWVSGVELLVGCPSVVLVTHCVSSPAGSLCHSPYIWFSSLLDLCLFFKLSRPPPVQKAIFNWVIFIKTIQNSSISKVPLSLEVQRFDLSVGLEFKNAETWTAQLRTLGSWLSSKFLLLCLQTMNAEVLHWHLWKFLDHWDLKVSEGDCFDNLNFIPGSHSGRTESTPKYYYQTPHREATPLQHSFKLFSLNILGMASLNM